MGRYVMEGRMYCVLHLVIVNINTKEMLRLCVCVCVCVCVCDNFVHKNALYYTLV